MSSSRRTSLKTPVRRKRNRDEREESGSLRMFGTGRKSLRLQHSMSLHIPLADVDSSDLHLNCYIDLTQEAFGLTYLEVDNTQNPDTLQALEVFRKGHWQAYLVGHLYNFEATEDSLEQLAGVLNTALSCEYQNTLRGVTFQAEISFLDDLNPTDNDNQAVVIEISQVTKDNEPAVVYKGYLLSWCCPMRAKGVFYPLLLCSGSAKYQSTINTILSERLDVCVNKLVLTQSEMAHLSTYCLIMLNHNDTYSAKFMYEIPGVGTLQVHQPVEKLLHIWSWIHEDDNIEVSLSEVDDFNQELKQFLETTFGIVFQNLQLQSFEVPKCVSLSRNCQMKFNSTRIIHVIFKYMNYLATKRLKLKILGLTQENNAMESTGA